MTDPIGTAQERQMLKRAEASMICGGVPLTGDQWTTLQVFGLRDLTDALRSRIAEVGRLTERVRELEAAEAARDDLGKRALEYHQETTCPCVAAERYVESCPKHGYVDGAALSLQRRV